jgi:hypothetical protein
MATITTAVSDRRSLMSHARSTPVSSNFQLIFNNALKTYEKCTKTDLLAHPLSAHLQTCDSPSAILAVIHQQVQGLHQSQRADERLTKWLNPTVTVLYALSATLGEGVGLVCPLDINSSEIHSLIFLRQVFSPAKVVFAGVGVLLLVRVLLYAFARAVVTPVSGSYRRPRKSGHPHRHLRAHGKFLPTP